MDVSGIILIRNSLVVHNDFENTKWLGSGRRENQLYILSPFKFSARRMPGYALEIYVGILRLARHKPQYILLN